MSSSSQTCFKEEAENHFILYFLSDDKDQSVHVEETEEIDFFKVILHLNSGGSVFITHRRNPKNNIRPRRQSPEIPNLQNSIKSKRGRFPQ